MKPLNKEDNVSKGCDNSQSVKHTSLRNLYNLETLLLKIFTGGQFSIADFNLNIAELRNLVEILVRKNKILYYSR